MLGSAAHTHQKQSARSPPHTHAEWQTNSVQAVSHQKIVVIRLTTPLLTKSTIGRYKERNYFMSDLLTSWGGCANLDIERQID